MDSFNIMNFEYIKQYYGVPAEIGRIVRFENRRGVIVEDRGNYIGVRFDGVPIVVSCHPTYNMEYLGMKLKEVEPENDKITFGKYKDMTYDEIANIDTGYILWLDENVDYVKLPRDFVDAVRMDNYEEDDAYMNAVESYYSAFDH